MNIIKPFDREKAFQLYLSLLEKAGSEVQITSPLCISEPIARTAINLAQSFHEISEQYRVTADIQKPANRFKTIQTYGEFLINGDCLYFQTYDGQQHIVAAYPHQAIALNVATDFNSKIKNPAILDDE